MREPLLQVRDLEVAFRSHGRAEFQAVCGINLDVERGQMHAVVGESGSGKSVTMLAIMGLLSPSARVSGSVRLEGEELIGKPERAMRRIRGARIGYIFQDPMSALNPLLTIGDQIAEAIRLHDRKITKRSAQERAVELLRLVAIPMAEQRALQYPHEFSGGMRQRVVIAMAMANEPSLLIADEPTTALDVTIQAQIMELLERLRAEKGVGIVLVTHDLGVVAGAASAVTIMYAGRVVEQGSVDEVFAWPRHPYTRGLLGSLPHPGRPKPRLDAIPGAPPPITMRPSGCAFHPRCAFAVERCLTEVPPLRSVGPSLSACHRAEELPPLISAMEAANAGR